MASTESPESATSLSKCDLDSGVLLSSSIARPVSALGVSFIAQSTLDGNAVASVGSEVIGASSSLQAEAEQIGRFEGDYHLTALASVKDRSASLSLYLF
jgi:hypothetical protein